MRVRDGGAWREIDSGRVYVGGAWKRLVEARAYVGGAWKTVATFTPPLSASVSPSTATATTTGGGTITTNSVTVTPSGGQAPYTYAWSRIVGTRSSVTASTSATTAFRCTLATEDEVADEWRCTVTDNFGSTATVDVLTTFLSISSS